MSNFPICLNIEGQLCVVIGGGRVAERKVRSLLACGGLVKVISPALSPGLRQLLAQGAISWKEGPYREGDLEQGVLVVAATDDTAVQVQAYREARSRNVPINVADKPAYCTFTLPAVVRRGDLTIAIATNGKSPALAKRLRMQLEESFGTEYELLLAILGEARRRILGLGLEQQANEEWNRQIVRLRRFGQRIADFLARAMYHRLRNRWQRNRLRLQRLIEARLRGDFDRRVRRRGGFIGGFTPGHGVPNGRSRRAGGLVVN